MARTFRKPFSSFSRKIQQRALENARRKLRGQRITNFVDDKFSEVLVNAFKNLQLENPQLSRDIQRAGQLKISSRTRGRELGFRDFREFQKLAGFSKKRFFTTKPTIKSKVKITIRQPKVIGPVRRRQAIPTTRREQFIGRGRTSARLQRETRTKTLSRLASSPIVFRTTDVITLGGRTAAKLERDRATLNKDVRLFNEKFGGRELSSSEFNQAQALGQKIDKNLATIEQRTTKFQTSKLAKFADVFDSKLDRTGQKTRTITQEKKSLPKRKQNLSSLKKQLTELKGKKGIKAIGQRFRLGTRIKSQKEAIKSIEQGRQVGPISPIPSLPIIQASFIPKGVKFVQIVGATKKGKGGSVITDIAFVTNTGRQGFVQGETIRKGKKAGTILVGQSGKPSQGFEGVVRLGKIQSFIGRSLDKTKAAPLTVKQFLKFPGAKKLSIISKNLKGILGKTAGQTGSFRGEKLPLLFGKKRITFRDIAMVSSAMRKGQVLKIASKSISGQKEKAKFLATIFGTTKATGKGASGGAAGLKLVKSQQFKEAAQEVVNLAVASIVKANKQGVTGKKALLATAATILAAKKVSGATTTRIIPRLTTKTRTLTRQRGGVRVTVTERRKAAIKPASRSGSRSVTRQVTKTAQKPKTEQKQIPRSLSKTKQLSALRLRALQRQKALQRALVRGRGISPAAIRGIGLLAFPIAKFKKKKLKKLIMKKTKQGYNVFAKPVKGKKLIKINKVPLTKTRARDLRNFIVDTSLSRTGKIKKTKKKVGRLKIKVPRNYAKKTKVKFRRFRIVKGKRKALPKGKVIERSRRLLDTRQERRKITLRKRLKQLRKPVRKARKRKRTLKRRGKR